jgi:CRISPR-associated exonuclease Cas4
MHVEGIWSDNEHTAKGTILHKNADERGYETDGKGRIVRALPLYSEQYGLSGKADVVEMRPDEIIPVEYKKGKRREFDNDNIQLMAQGFCLEEMFNRKISRGFIFHAASKRRREVIFDETLRNETIAVIEAVRNLLESETIPAAEFKPRCNGCSLYGTCLPKLSDAAERSKALENLVNI